jgi:hypothetical protein
MKEQATDREWLPLSLAQHAIWLESKLNRRAILQLGGWAKIEGEIDESLARQAVSLVMARHDALRLRVDDEEPRQWLEASCAPPLMVASLPSTDDPDKEFEKYIDEIFASPLPFGDDVLFHISLIQHSPECCYMLWRFHHIVADSVSTTAAMRHWTEAYIALMSDEPAELAPRSSYRSVIDSDAEYLRSQDYQRDLTYWKQRFEPLPPVLIDTATLMQKSIASSQFHSDFLMVADRWRSIQHLGGQWQISTSRIVFALFALVIADRYQEWDIVSGVALHRRDRSARQALGMFSGVIPVRYRFNPSDELSKAAYGFSSQIDQDLRFQRMPVDDLARVLGLFRTGRSRLFDIVMSYMPIDRWQSDSLSDGLPVTSDTVALPEASPISLHVTEIGDGLKVRIAVNPYILNGSEAETLVLLLRFAVDSAVNGDAKLVENLFSGNDKEHAIVVDKSYPEDEREEWII